MHKSRLDDGSVLVAFELPAEVAATSVSLVGDFNDWSPEANPLHLLADGRFHTEVTLPAGQRSRFRYLIDGQRWENDWAADDYVPNGLGADDSVVDLTHVEALQSAPEASSLEVDLTEASPPAVSPSEVSPPDLTLPGPSPLEVGPPEVGTSRPWWKFWARRTA